MIIYEYFTTNKLIESQTVNKRFYRKVVPWLLQTMKLYENGGYFVMENTDIVRVLDKNKLEWTELRVKKKDETMSDIDRKKFFAEQRDRVGSHNSYCKILQVNSHEVYIMSPFRCFLPYELSEAEWYRKCVKVDIYTGELTVKADILTERYRFNACSVGNVFYLVGGIDKKEQMTDTCEKYNICKDEWTKTP